MRIAVTYKCNKIPNSYRMMFLSNIKQALFMSNEKYFKEIYEYEDKKNKKSKNFCFGVYVKDFKQENDELKCDEVILNISSPDHNFMLNLYNGLLKIDKYKYKEYEIKKSKVMMIKEKNIDKDYCILKSISPMCIKDMNGKYLDISDENFIKELNYIVDLILKNYRGNGLIKSLEFTQLNMRKVVVKEKISDFTDACGKDYIFINSYKGEFLLKGDKKDLNDIYKLGIGFRRSQGFGMIDVV